MIMQWLIFEAILNSNDADAHTCAHTISRDDDWRRRPMMTNYASDRLNVSEIILNQSEDTDVFASDHHDGRWRRPIHNQRRRRPMMASIHDDNDDGWQRQAMTVDRQQPRSIDWFSRCFAEPMRKLNGYYDRLRIDSNDRVILLYSSVSLACHFR